MGETIKFPKVKLKEIDPVQPDWVCSPCGIKKGRRLCGTATFHMDTCGVCGQHTSVTEPRDWGFLKAGWKDG